jgi:hypothetical protein
MEVTKAADRRAQTIRLFTFLGGLYFFVYFLLPDSAIEAIGLKERHEPISNGFIAIGAMAVGLGLFNLISAHGSRLAFRKKGWPYSFALLAGLVSMLLVTGAQWRQSLTTTAELRKSQVVSEFAQRIIEDAEGQTAAPPLSTRIDALERYARQQVAGLDTSALGTQVAEGPLKTEVRESATALNEKLGPLTQVRQQPFSPDTRAAIDGVSKAGARLSAALSVYLRDQSSRTTVQQLYNFLYDAIFNQLGAAMFSLLGVYIAAAAFRAFRIRTLDSALMMTAALVVMLGQISLGKMISDELPVMRQWLLEVPNSAAFRAIRLGAAVAGLMLAIRMWLSIESKSFSTRKK